MSSTNIPARKKQVLLDSDNSPIPAPPTSSPSKHNGKCIDDKRFSTFNSLKAMSARGAYIDENGVRWVSQINHLYITSGICLILNLKPHST